MPTFHVTAPDGTHYEINGPDGATEEQAMDQAMAQHAIHQKAVESATNDYYDPTEGMSTGEKLAAGAGKALVDLGRGAGQWLGLESRQDVQDSRDRDKALMNTTAGKVGNIGGNILATLPALAIPGVNTAVGAAALGAGLGALQPSTSSTETATNIGLGGATGYGGQVLGGKLAQLASRQLQSRAALASLKQAQNADRDGVLHAAQAKGYVVPPTAANPNAVNTVMESYAGKIATRHGASTRNALANNQAVRDDLSLPADSPITRPVLEGVRRQAGQVYENVKQALPATFAADPQYKADIAGIRGGFPDLETHYPGITRQANPDIQSLADSLDVTSHNGAGAMELSKNLRSLARSNIQGGFSGSGKSGQLALGRAQMEGARAIEDQIQRQLASQGQGDLATAWDAARTRYAKSYQAQAALQGGNIIGQRLATQMRKGKMSTGNMGLAAKFADYFPEVSAVPKSGVGVSKLAAVAGSLSGGAALYAHSPGLAALSAAISTLPYPLRAGMLSRMGQRALAQPSYAPSLTGTAALTGARQLGRIGQLAPAAALPMATGATQQGYARGGSVSARLHALQGRPHAQLRDRPAHPTDRSDTDSLLGDGGGTGTVSVDSTGADSDASLQANQLRAARGGPIHLAEGTGPAIRTLLSRLMPAYEKLPEEQLQARQIEEQKNAKAPELGMFSPLDLAIQNAPKNMENATPQQWLQYMKPGQRKIERAGVTFPVTQRELNFSGWQRTLDTLNQRALARAKGIAPAEAAPVLTPKEEAQQKFKAFTTKNNLPTEWDNAHDFYNSYSNSVPHPTTGRTAPDITNEPYWDEFLEQHYHPWSRLSSSRNPVPVDNLHPGVLGQFNMNGDKINRNDLLNFMRTTRPGIGHSVGGDAPDSTRRAAFQNYMDPVFKDNPSVTGYTENLTLPPENHWDPNVARQIQQNTASSHWNREPYSWYRAVNTTTPEGLQGTHVIEEQSDVHGKAANRVKRPAQSVMQLREQIANEPNLSPADKRRILENSGFSERELDTNDAHELVDKARKPYFDRAIQWQDLNDKWAAMSDEEKAANPGQNPANFADELDQTKRDAKWKQMNEDWSKMPDEEKAANPSADPDKWPNLWPQKLAIDKLNLGRVGYGSIEDINNTPPGRVKPMLKGLPLEDEYPAFEMRKALARAAEQGKDFLSLGTGLQNVNAYASGSTPLEATRGFGTGRSRGMVGMYGGEGVPTRDVTTDVPTGIGTAILPGQLRDLAKKYGVGFNEVAPVAQGPVPAAKERLETQPLRYPTLFDSDAVRQQLEMPENATPSMSDAAKSYVEKLKATLATNLPKVRRELDTNDPTIAQQLGHSANRDAAAEARASLANLRSRTMQNLERANNIYSNFGPEADRAYLLPDEDYAKAMDARNKLSEHIDRLNPYSDNMDLPGPIVLKREFDTLGKLHDQAAAAHAQFNQKVAEENAKIDAENAARVPGPPPKGAMMSFSPEERERIRQAGIQFMSGTGAALGLQAANNASQGTMDQPAPQSFAHGGLALAEGTTAAVRRLMDLWHGTHAQWAPTDTNPLGQFDLSKMRTGSGNSMYGHGQYAATEPKVARMFTEDRLTPDQRSRIEDLRLQMSRTMSQLMNNAPKTVGFGQTTKQILDANPGWVQGRDYSDKLDQMGDELRSIKGQPGSLYRLQMDPDVFKNQLFNWDANIRRQPEAMQAMYAQMPSGVRDQLGRLRVQNPLGGEVYAALARHIASSPGIMPLEGMQQASDAFKDAGIPGHRFQTGAAINRPNVVLFDPSVAKAVDRIPSTDVAPLDKDQFQDYLYNRAQNMNLPLTNPPKFASGGLAHAEMETPLVQAAIGTEPDSPLQRRLLAAQLPYWTRMDPSGGLHPSISRHMGLAEFAKGLPYQANSLLDMLPGAGQPTLHNWTRYGSPLPPSSPTGDALMKWSQRHYNNYENIANAMQRKLGVTDARTPGQFLADAAGSMIPATLPTSVLARSKTLSALMNLMPMAPAKAVPGIALGSAGLNMAAHALAPDAPSGYAGGGLVSPFHHGVRNHLDAAIRLGKLADKVYPHYAKKLKSPLSPKPKPRTK